MHDGPGARAPIRLGEYVLDPGSGELRSAAGGDRQSLSPQTLSVLLALLDRPGALVTRDELRQRLWPADTYVDFEHGLNAVVKRLRDALGDSADTPRYIETVPRRGYRLVATVDHDASSATAPVPPPPDVVPSTGNTATSTGWRLHLRWAATLFAAASLIWIAYHARQRAQAADQPLGMVEPVRVTFGPGLQTDAAWTPDGTRIAFAWDADGNFDLFVQDVRGGDPTRLTRTPANETTPVWSPDGQRLVFRSEEDGGGLWVMDPRGGPVRRIATFGEQPAWMPDGRHILFTVPTWQSLHLVRADGGEPPREILAGALAGGAWLSAAVHPDGRIGVLGIPRDGRQVGFYVADPGQERLHAVDMGPARALLSSHSEARLQWNRAGTEMFLEAGSPGARVVWRVPVAPRTLAWGVPVRLTRGLDRAERAAVSPDGRRLAFSSVQSTTQAWLFPFDADRGTPPGAGRPLTDEDATVANLALSPDGSRLYFVEERPGQTAGQGVQLDLGTGERTRVAKDVAPIPSRSGRLSYLISRPSSATGGGEEFALAVHEAAGRERLIAPWGPAAMHPSAWGDGDDVVLATRTEETYTGPASLVEWPATALATAPRRVVLSSPATQFWQGQYSPDGRWIGFVALDLSGRGTLELGVVPARGAPASTWARLAGDHRWPDKPRWSPDGRTLYFLSPASNGFFNLWGVRVDPASGGQAGSPFQVTHFDSPRWHVCPAMARCDIGVSAGRLVLPMRTVKGSVWTIAADAS